MYFLLLAKAYLYLLVNQTKPPLLQADGS